MEQINFLAGSEKRFFDFISSFNDKDKIFLVSHTDLDGIASAKVINEVVNPDFIKFVGYDGLNDSLVKEIVKSKAKKVIFSDLFMDEEIINKLTPFCEVLIIDHHMIKKNLNSERVVFMNSEGYCGAYLSYYLFSKAQNIEKLDWLVACASIADYCFTKNEKWMSEIFTKYGEKFTTDFESLQKVKKFWDTQYAISLGLIYFTKREKECFDLIKENFEIGKLKEFAAIVKKEIDEGVEKFEKEKREFKNGYFWEFNPKFPVASIVANILSGKYNHKTMIIAQERGEIFKFSARNTSGKEDMNLLLSNLVKGFENSSGGGHFKASGGHVQLKDKEEFKKKLFALK
jgi:single-stranded DNA-specific DHH superfamily exonuclease